MLAVTATDSLCRCSSFGCDLGFGLLLPLTLVRLAQRVFFLHVVLRDRKERSKRMSKKV